MNKQFIAEPGRLNGLEDAYLFAPPVPPSPKQPPDLSITYF